VSHEGVTREPQTFAGRTVTRDHVFVGLFVLALVFSIQIDLDFGLSKFASINSEDLAIGALTLVLLIRLAQGGDWELSLSLPRVTGFMLFVSAWLLLTLFVAHIRSPYTILPNLLWTFKWFEAIILLIVLQQFLGDRLARFALRTLTLAGSVLAVLVVVSNALPSAHEIRLSGRTVFSTAVYRPTRFHEMDPFFWGNPNAIGVFYFLMTVVFFALLIHRDSRNPWLFVGLGLSFLVLVLSGSRTALLALVAGSPVVLFELRDRFSIERIVWAAVVVGASAVAFLLIWDPFFLRKFFITIDVGKLFRSGQITFSGIQHGGIEKRVEMAQRGLRLFSEQPLFGYGWFASPENPRVSIIDMHYPALLVDLGLAGAGLMLTLYALILYRFHSICRKSDSWIPAVGAAWYVGLLVSGLANSNIRVPRMMFITILLLVAARAVSDEDSITSPG